VSAAVPDSNPQISANYGFIIIPDKIHNAIKQAVHHVKQFEPISLTDKLEHLGIDQLDMLEIAIELEEKLNLFIKDEQLMEAKTLGDIAVLFAQSGNVAAVPPTGGLKNWWNPVTGENKETAPEAKIDTVPGTATPSWAVPMPIVVKGEVCKPEGDPLETLLELSKTAELPAKQKWKKKYTDDASTVGETLTVTLPENTGVDHVVQVKKMLEEADQADSYVIVPAGPNILQIDLDEPESVVLFKERYELLQKTLPTLDLSEITYTRSKSMRWHVTIYLKLPLSIHERIFLQMALGSDPIREICGYVNHSKGHMNPILLLERKEEWEKQKKLT
jgi:acyl carrier protein